MTCISAKRSLQDKSLEYYASVLTDHIGEISMKTRKKPHTPEPCTSVKKRKIQITNAEKNCPELDKLISRIQHSIQIFPDKYNKETVYKGASPRDVHKIFTLKHLKTNAPQDDSWKNQLRKCSIQGDEELVLTSLRELSICNDPGYISVWISEHLSVDLGLHLDVRSKEPEHILQVLFFGKDEPAFLLTLYKNKEECVSMATKVTQASAIDIPIAKYECKMQNDTSASLRSRSRAERSSYRDICHEYAVSVVKALWSSLLTYCYCDFVILPCTLSFQEFIRDPHSLQKEIDNQLERTRRYYGGLLKLNMTSYRSLKAAATGLSAVTRVPYLLHGLEHSDNVSDSLLCMDKEWHDVMSLIIEQLLQKGSFTLASEQNCLKVNAATLEAAKRVSATRHVTIFTKDKTIVKCIEKVKSLMMKERGVSPNLTHETPMQGGAFLHVQVSRG